MPEPGPEASNAELEAAAVALPLVMADESRLIDEREALAMLLNLRKNNPVVHQRVAEQIESLYNELSEHLLGAGQTIIDIDSAQLKGIIAKGVTRAAGQVGHDIGKAILSAQDLKNQVFGERQDGQT